MKSFGETLLCLGLLAGMALPAVSISHPAVAQDAHSVSVSQRNVIQRAISSWIGSCVTDDVRSITPTKLFRTEIFLTPQGTFARPPRVLSVSPGPLNNNEARIIVQMLETCINPSRPLRMGDFPLQSVTRFGLPIRVVAKEQEAK